MKANYGRSEPGHPGIPLHSDAQPWGSKIFGFEHSCPRLVRILYYLDALSPDVSPLKIVPRSHLSFHDHGNPYNRYENLAGQLMVTVPAGSAVIFNPYIFHGNFPNVGPRSRSMMALSYRPKWAGPAGECPAWPAQELGRCSAAAREVMGDRNQRVWIPAMPNRPKNMPTTAPGIDPERYKLV